MADDEMHWCWSECCDQGPHGCICGNDCQRPDPQPAPTAECGICEGTGKWTEVVRDGHVPRAVLRDCPVHGSKQPVEPPRIEDMAPGTTFTCEYQDWATNGRPKQRYIAAIGQTTSGVKRVYFLYPTGASLHMREAEQEIDPSTIRDVTPPKEA